MPRLVVPSFAAAFALLELVDQDVVRHHQVGAVG